MRTLFAGVVAGMAVLVVAAARDQGRGAQDPSGKLATVLVDLARAVPQDDDRAPVTPAGRPLAVDGLPASVQDAGEGQWLDLASDNTIQVYLLLSEITEARIRAVAEAGAVVELVEAASRRLQVRVPASRLRRIASLPFVDFVRLPSYGWPQAGLVSSEGDAIHNSDIARAQFDVTGEGVRVGVISDGIRGIFGEKCRDCAGVPGGPMATGDLPAAAGTRTAKGLLTSVTGRITAESARPDGDLEARRSLFRLCGFPGAGAEGTALLEVVHDLAPGASLAFANASTSLEFSAAVNVLAAANDVVVDDLGFFGEPANGQSSVSRNTAAALNNPANRIRTYITSVGNAADDHYFGRFTDSGVDGSTVTGVSSPGRLHLFQRTDETTDVLGLGNQPYDVISLPTNGQVVIVLTWDDPAGASGNNYDLYLVEERSGRVVARSTDQQRGSQDPIEFIVYANRGESGFHRILIQNAGNAVPRDLNMFAFRPQCAFDGPRALVSGRPERHNYNTATRSIAAQGDTGGTPVSAISVGAICSASADAAAVFAGSSVQGASCNDRSHGTIQFFSSRGPTLDGRIKPDISAIDGVSITGTGRFGSPFFGTSAAAPHVAGIAALVLQAAPCLRTGTPGALEASPARATLRDLILRGADPIGDPVPNNVFGHGLANAFRSVEAAIAACAAPSGSVR